MVFFFQCQQHVNRYVNIIYFYFQKASDKFSQQKLLRKRKGQRIQIPALFSLNSLLLNFVPPIVGQWFVELFTQFIS